MTKNISRMSKIDFYCGDLLFQGKRNILAKFMKKNIH